MTKHTANTNNNNLVAELTIDCEKCSGLCCVALYCTKTDGFPADKPPGEPCKNLMSDFRCAIHPQLSQKGMKGCLAYDCFGAGQKVTQHCYPNSTWQTNPAQAQEIFDTFLVVFQLHQMSWYLLDALSVVEDHPLKSTIEALLAKNQQMTSQTPEEILNLDVESYKLEVNRVLKKVSEMIANNSAGSKQTKDFLGKNFKRANLDGRDFIGALLIAASLEGCSLRKTNFLAADMRDANIKNTDLSSSIFLTQMQINSAKGNVNTKLPTNLSRPSTWRE